jgi:CRP-like cAMP-binding protein
MKEVTTLSVIEKALRLSNWNLFRQLALDEVALIAARTDEVRYEAGEIVTAVESPTGSAVHFVLSGAIEISMDGAPVRTAREGQAAGSLTAFGSEAEQEELRTVEPTHALVLSAADLETVLAEHPDFALAVIRSLVATVRGLEGGR